MNNMKLSDFLKELGDIVAYYPSLARVLGDVNETIFICQLAYWEGKQANAEGWIYKNSEELEEETGLSYKEQLNARKGLKNKGILEEKYARLEHQMYFRVNWDSLNAIWESRHIPIGHMANTPSGISLNGTTDITTDNKEDLQPVTENKEDLQPIIESANKTIDAILALEANNPKIKYAKVREDFEREFNFNPLPWDGKNRQAWARLERHLYAACQKDPACIQRVAAYWRGDGRYSMPTRNQIYADPDRLIATWPQDIAPSAASPPPAPIPERPPIVTPEMIEAARAKRNFARESMQAKEEGIK